MSMVLMPGRFDVCLDAAEVKKMITSQGGCCAMMIDMLYFGDVCLSRVIQDLLVSPLQNHITYFIGLGSF